MVDSGELRSLTLFTRQSCALCDYMVLALEMLRPRFRFAYTKIDVDTDDDLIDQYGLRVPVLLDRDHEICAGHFEPAVLEAYLSTNVTV